MKPLAPFALLALLSLPGVPHISGAQITTKQAAPVPVPEAEPANTTSQPFVDKQYKVRFTVPRGWEIARKDYQVSTFHMDARSAPPTAQLRGLAMLDFNPYARSTLAGALFYFSVEKKTTDVECAAQATQPGGAVEVTSGDFSSVAPPSTAISTPANHKDTQDVAGIIFAHGHDEHGQICIEARDEVYTAWHKHACYRFDLAINTFCAESSGAQPISPEQIRSVDQRMADILSTVTFGWQNSPPHPITAPEVPTEQPRRKSIPSHSIPAIGS